MLVWNHTMPDNPKSRILLIRECSLLVPCDLQPYFDMHREICSRNGHATLIEKPICSYAWLLGWIAQSIAATVIRLLLGYQSKPVPLIDRRKSLPSFFTDSKLNMFNAP